MLALLVGVVPQLEIVTMKKHSTGATRAEAAAVEAIALNQETEEVTFKLPKEVARRLRFLAPWDDKTFEAMLAEAVVSYSHSAMECYTSEYGPDEDLEFADGFIANGSPDQAKSYVEASAKRIAERNKRADGWKGPEVAS